MGPAAVAACAALGTPAANAQFAPPTNDLCSNPQTLTLNTPFYGTNASASATNDGPIAPCSSASGFRGVWFSFTPALTQRYQVSACHSVFDTALALFSAADCTTFNPASFVLVPGGCNDDHCGGGPGPGNVGSTSGSLISNIPLTAGHTYLIRLSGVSASGWYQISVSDFTTSGACCNNNGSCLLTPAATCSTIDATSTFMGGGTSCAPSPCLGACCNSTTYACTLTPPAGTGSCASTSVGVWQGFGSTCAANPCPTGACCSIFGQCSVTLQRSCATAWVGGVTCLPASNCSANISACCNNNTFACTFAALPCPVGFTFAGFGTSCSPNACVLGSCCSAFACTRTFAASCTGASAFLPNSSTCSPTPCSAACCDASGSGGCTLTVGAPCPAGFTSMSVGSTCTPNPCTYGACCTPNGACNLLPGVSCNTPSIFIGPTSSCTPDNPCALILGACCSPTGNCSVTTPSGCSIGSMFQGTGVGNTGGACTSSTFCQALTILGACCSATGACSATTFNGCTGVSTWLGAGVGYTSGAACTTATFCQAVAYLGSCCSANGACSISTPLGCTAPGTFMGLGSNYSGTGVSCSAAAFCQTSSTLGTCCTSATCSITTIAGCIGPGSAFQGLDVNYPGSGTACTSTTYCQSPTILGACCNTSGGCSVTLPSACPTPSAFQGLGVGFTSGTACTSATFCQNTAYLGACCSVVGTCVATAAAACTFPSVFQGPGVGYTGGSLACNPVTVCHSATILGTCCSSSGICSITTPSGCLATNVFAGLGVNYTIATTACTNVNYCTAGAGNVLGACCSAGGACAATTLPGCAPGSQWQGLGIGTSAGVCSPLTVCQSTAILGACCSTAGVCTITPAGACPGPSVFAGVGGGYTTGTSCTNNFCNPSLGACCTATGACSATTLSGCTANATFRGAGVGVTGTSCTTTTICQTSSIMGACCSTTGACTATTPAGCPGTNTFVGIGVGYTSGTACTSASFCTTGAGNILGACCSITSGACIISSAPGCTTPNLFTAIGSTCTPINPCGGACCSSTGACTALVNAAACAGAFTNGALCSPTPAACATGACCTPTGCTSVTAAGCTTASGTFGGNGTTCSPGYSTPILGSAAIENIAAGSTNAGTSWIAGGGGGTNSLDDGSNLGIPLGFTFNFFGTPQTTIGACTNGYAFFGVNSAAFANVPIPTIALPNSILAPYWVDQILTIATQITWKSLGVAPYRRFIVQWNNVGRYATAGPTGTHTYQIILYETADLVEYRYGTLTTGTPNNTITPTVGIEDSTGTIGTSYDAALLPPGGHSLFFSPMPTPCSSPTLMGACCTGAVCTTGTLAACIISSGSYQGNNALCNPLPCITGACCAIAGSCAVVIQSVCIADGSLYGGDNSTCTSFTCPAVGACCIDSACAVAFQSNCTGTFTPAGNCAPNLCSGACCTGTGICTLTTSAAACTGTFFTLGTSCSPLPTGCFSSDECQTTTAVLALGVPSTGDNSAATNSALILPNTSDPFCTQTSFGSGMPKDIFWKFTAPATALYDLSTCGSAVADTILSVHSGCPATQANLVSCNDDSTSGPNNISCVTIQPLGGNALQSHLPSLSLNAGTLYYIRVAGYNGTTGGLTVTIRLPGATGACCVAVNCTLTDSASCPGAFIPAGLCTPNPCPLGVCCRGSTCTTAIGSSAGCTGSLTTGQAAGARFVPAHNCNSFANARIPCCYADYNKTGGIDAIDIFDFLSDWFAGSPFANTGSTGDPATLSTQNIFDFLGIWFAGGC